MQTWITVHYPHPVDDSLRWDVYLQDTELSRGRRLQRGDLVLFWLTGRGPKVDGVRVSTVRVNLPTGPVRVKLDIGPQRAGGLVGSAYVDGAVTPKTQSPSYTHNYGDSDKWTHYVPCRGFTRGQIVKPADYERIVGVRAPYRTGLSLFHHGDRAVAGLLRALGAVEPAAAAPPAAAMPAPRLATQEERLRDAAVALARAGVRNVQHVMQRVADVAGQPERTVEDAVKTFLVALGHQEGHIVFQAGRIDLRVTGADGDTLMVVEVKRDLRRSRDEALRQGFDYANRTSARLVVLSDADRYEVYDLDRPGRGYEAVRVGEFQVTQFTAKDAAVLDVLKPG